MKRYSTIMSVLLALALPVAGLCAEKPVPPEKADAKAESKADAKPEAKTDAKSDAKGAAKSEEKVEAIKKSMSKTKHSTMMGGEVPTDVATSDPTGKVVQTMDGGGYTYANIEKDGKNTWVAYPTSPTKVGDTLKFKGCMEMKNFPSKALNRTFESVMFCNEPEVKSAGKKLDGKKSPGSGGATAGAGKVKVEKAEGPNAYTIAEIFAKSGTLNGKRVVVKGQVVKVSSGIMDRNWLHLQDGTGSEKKKTHDLVVTTKEMADVGDVVTVTGTLAKDKDFGGGYKYNAIIEKGSLQK